MSGFVLLHRAAFGHWTASRPYCTGFAWAHLIATAAWSPKTVKVSGQLVLLQRGQTLVGRKYLAEQWGWSEKAVRTFLEKLRADHMIEIGPQKGQLPAIATLCNYEEYQASLSTEGQQKASSGPAEGQQRAILKETNKQTKERGRYAQKGTTGNLEALVSGIVLNGRPALRKEAGHA